MSEYLLFRQTNVTIQKMVFRWAGSLIYLGYAEKHFCSIKGNKGKEIVKVRDGSIKHLPRLATFYLNEMRLEGKKQDQSKFGQKEPLSGTCFHCCITRNSKCLRFSKLGYVYYLFFQIYHQLETINFGEQSTPLNVHT